MKTIPQISTKQTTISHLKSLNTNKTKIYSIGNPGLAWDRHKHLAGLNQLMRSQQRLKFIFLFSVL
jgi:hypothetical protein